MMREKAPAKINLTLAVTGKQEDFHDVEMIMTTIDLADYVTVTAVPNTRRIVVESDSEIVPRGKKNIAYQVAELFLKKYNIHTGLNIFIEKRIPIAGGLAGGSANAAATLRALRQLFDVDCTNEELCEIGAQVGSDIPFCIIGGTAIATGRGEILTPIKSPPKCWVIIVNPRMSVSTRDIYRKFRLEDAGEINTTAMLNAIEREDFNEICAYLSNDLEPVTTKIFPVINEIRKEMIANGASGARMSGSGATVFALVYTEKKANHLYRQMKKKFSEYTVHMTRMLG
ncbi:MAG: 4-(cytidine 5'-diphospho)-2-C-methyl-D-erythritol kinase [Turicibacter sp.]|nr:4-(cytidine 5'-diphospho)-2-C-methyl-D-erythritol kinase [Turicibacter sp.]